MKKRDFLQTFTYIIEYVVLVASILVFWHIMGETGNLNTAVLPTFKNLLKKFGNLLSCKTLISNHTFYFHLWVSLRRVLIGYFISAALGIFLGILIGLSKHLDNITHLLIQVIKPIPPIAWIPLVILWFGIGESGKVFLIFLGGFFTILINVVDGIKQSDPKLIEVSKVFETPPLKKIFRVIIPSAIPNIFTGLRVGLSSCWMCVVAAELVASSTGLGFMISDSRQYGMIDVVIIGMITIGVIGKIMDSLLHFGEKKIIKWV